VGEYETDRGWSDRTGRCRRNQSRSNLRYPTLLFRASKCAISRSWKKVATRLYHGFAPPGLSLFLPFPASLSLLLCICRSSSDLKVAILRQNRGVIASGDRTSLTERYGWKEFTNSVCDFLTPKQRKNQRIPVFARKHR